MISFIPIPNELSTKKSKLSELTLFTPIVLVSKLVLFIIEIHVIKKNTE